MKFARAILLISMVALLAGCADTRYYWQSVRGHWQLMQAAQPVTQWLARDDLAPQLRQRLLLAQSIRRYAVTQLHLPDNASYQSYADLQRRYAVWNVVAAPELSLRLKTWCYVAVGCASYRGYFDEADARAMAAELRAQGLEVSVYGVPAYSTLGWMNWAGGDPLLNTWVYYIDAELARLMFHELAHQVVFVSDDTVFNESFATAVERLGVASWLEDQATAQARREYEAFEQRRQQFRALTRATRERLQRVYEPVDAEDLTDSARLAAKRRVMQDFRSDYAELKQQWGGYSGFDAWVAQANNAAFGAQAAYDELVPGFEALFEREGHDWQRFFDAVKYLASQPASERAVKLRTWATQFDNSVLACSTSSRSIASIGSARAAN